MKSSSIALVATLALFGGLGSANASTLPSDPSVGTPTVLYSQSSLVQGESASVTTLDVPGAGELFLTLTDLDFMNTFSSLDFSLSSSQTDLVGLADAGTLHLNTTGPTTLYADVFANLPTASDDGLYNLTATFLSSADAAPVPLPGAGVMLAGALMLLAGALWGQRGRRGRRALTPTLGVAI